MLKKYFRRAGGKKEGRKALLFQQNYAVKPMGSAN
jgi:hypothetical protein